MGFLYVVEYLHMSQRTKRQSRCLNKEYTGGKSHSLLVKGFSIEKKPPTRRRTRTHLTVKSATPSASCRRALSKFLRLCLALENTLHGVPKCTYLIFPVDNNRKITCCVLLRSRLNSGPFKQSTAGKTGRPICLRAEVRCPLPEKTSQHIGILL